MPGYAPITLPAPPSKSLSHRAVIAAGLAQGESLLSGVLECDDLDRTCAILQAVGVGITRQAQGIYTIIGLGGAPGIRPSSARNLSPPSFSQASPLRISVGEAGTTCRLLTAVLAAGYGVYHLRGQGRMHSRPMSGLLNVLTALGTAFCFEEKEGFLPFSMIAQGLASDASRAGSPDTSPPAAGHTPPPQGSALLGHSLPTDGLFVDTTQTSQFLSSLLLAAPVTLNGLTLCTSQQKAVSRPYVLLSLQTLHNHGVKFSVDISAHDVKNSTIWKPVNWQTPGCMQASGAGILRFSVSPSGYLPFSGRIEGDYSTASYFLAAGALGSRPVTISGLNPHSLQGDRLVLDVLERMGARVTWCGDKVTVCPAQLYGIDISLADAPDIVPTVALLAARAMGPSTLRSVGHLRFKESDRLGALQAELAKVGCAVRLAKNDLLITPIERSSLPTKAHLCCHGDHRLAMSLSLLELGRDCHILLDEPDVVSKSYPNFHRDWAQIRK